MSSATESLTGTELSSIDFQTDPARYRHWQVKYEAPIATIAMDVSEVDGLHAGYELKLNSYDLGVDIELYDILQRMRFEHPEISAVVITSAKERVFCAGANIKMLGQSTHAHKVNFCKFTNETRNSIEDASEYSGQTYLCAVNGPCAGGGYELALACEEIIMVDDGATTVSLPELPLLGVLPGTGGLTRLVDKRLVRSDRADFFSTVEEGIRGERAVAWNLVDAVVPASKFAGAIDERASALAARSSRPRDESGITLTPLRRQIGANEIHYETVSVEIDRTLRVATITVSTPDSKPPSELEAIKAEGANYFPLLLARELDDAILHLRTNEDEIGTWLIKSLGTHDYVAQNDRSLAAFGDDWFVREVTLYLKRVYKRLEVSSRSLIAVIGPGSCFSGSLLELALACDQSFMLDGEYEGDPRAPATIALGAFNFGGLPMVNGLSRIASRFLADPSHLDVLEQKIDIPLLAADADALGLVTHTPDDIDWDEEIRIVLESRASFSPDALTGLEANLRFAGPETMESKIFARLSAWQNWIFQRPNAVGDNGALVLYGTGARPEYNKQRV